MFSPLGRAAGRENTKRFAVLSDLADQKANKPERLSRRAGRHRALGPLTALVSSIYLKAVYGFMDRRRRMGPEVTPRANGQREGIYKPSSLKPNSSKCQRKIVRTREVASFARLKRQGASSANP